MNRNETFHLSEVVHHLKHYLPAQAPLKDFIHHNTLHAFQNNKFFDGILSAKSIFGYKTLLSPKEYKKFYSEGKISDEKLLTSIQKHFPNENANDNCAFGFESLLQNIANANVGFGNYNLYSYPQTQSISIGVDIKI